MGTVIELKTFLLLFGQYVEMHYAKKPLLAATSTPNFHIA